MDSDIMDSDIASSKDELLYVISRNPGCDPYNMVSGIVRGVGVDRWLNQMSRDGLIEAVDFSVPTVKITDKGTKWLQLIKELDNDKGYG